ncbi:orotidine-5'-phosphate decarboxylase [candidate division KSB1 bacterium]|nr:orotidine-5'-phosphate decarboxylase [candidate division KSB1 bacterium]
MNFTERVKNVIDSKRSFVCVGLDTDIKLIPESISGSDEERIYAFNKSLIEATSEYASAYKLNSAFYEACGEQGYRALKRTIQIIPDDTITILDAKRADIGNSSALYARAAFDILKAESMTVNPYMGYDSIEPFMLNEERGVFILCLTSNPGSDDLQKLVLDDARLLFMETARKIVEWNKRKNLGMVVGATHPRELAQIRKIAPDIPLLLPGIGAQQGDLEQTVRNAIGKQKAPAFINSSRGIIYASSGEDFARAAGKKCKKLRDSINAVIDKME